MTAYLLLDSWAGRQRVPVEVVGETPKRYRVKMLEAVTLPNRRYAAIGDVVLVPKGAVTINAGGNDAGHVKDRV